MAAMVYKSAGSPNSRETISEVLRDAVSRHRIDVVFDCGSRDALDGLDVANTFGARELHIFEPNPVAVALCRKNVAGSVGPLQVTINEFAVGDKVGEVTFRPIDPKRTETTWDDGNIGASSLFQANSAYPYERYVQSAISVRMITLDDYCKTHIEPDLLWIDVQGAELMLFKGAQKVLKTVKVIQVELSFRAVYCDQPLFWEVDRYLRQEGFRRRGFGGVPGWKATAARFKFPLSKMWQANVIYSR